jgi:hypothetical protein
MTHPASFTVLPAPPGFWRFGCDPPHLVRPLPILGWLTTAEPLSVHGHDGVKPATLWRAPPVTPIVSTTSARTLSCNSRTVGSSGA